VDKALKIRLRRRERFGESLAASCQPNNVSANSGCGGDLIAYSLHWGIMSAAFQRIQRGLSGRFMEMTEWWFLEGRKRGNSSAHPLRGATAASDGARGSH
jgi:hypothetical protein